MSRLVGSTRSPVRQPQQPVGLLWAYLGVSFALAWAAWVPAAVLVRDPQRPGLPAFAGGLVVLQTLGAAAPTIAAQLLLRVAGRRDLISWIAGRYRLWRVHWRGLALPLLQGRWNALVASVLLGLVWGVWHLPLMVATGGNSFGVERSRSSCAQLAVQQRRRLLVDGRVCVLPKDARLTSGMVHARLWTLA